MIYDDERAGFLSLSKDEQRSIVILLEAANIDWNAFARNQSIFWWFSHYDELLVIAVWSTFAMVKATKKHENRNMWAMKKCFTERPLK